MPFDGKLNVFVHGCRDLKSVQILGKMDPYVKLTFKDEMFKTQTAKDEHQTPVFDQEFIFNVVKAEDQDILFLSVYNDELGADKMIGRASIPFPHIPTLPQGKKVAVELFDPENFRKITGYIDVVFHWNDANAPIAQQLPSTSAQTYEQPQVQPAQTYEQPPQAQQFHERPQIAYQTQPQIVYQQPQVVNQQPTFHPDPVVVVTQNMAKVHLEQKQQMPQPKQNQLSDGVYFIKAKHSGKFLDVNGASKDNGAVIHTWDFHGNDNQKFRAHQVSQGVYTFQAVHSGKFIDVSGNSKDNGAGIHQWEGHQGDNQKFKLIPDGEGFNIVAVHSGKAIDIGGAKKENGSKALQWDLHQQDHQTFIFQKVD